MDWTGPSISVVIFREPSTFVYEPISFKSRLSQLWAGNILKETCSSELTSNATIDGTIFSGSILLVSV
jgi:hypothetical protein